ncbi:P-loop ATPase, Sll1717 family [Saccharothrix sp. NRRL B-16314]|uniref:P-loop ATPase, Sll1717 family n=1 Tax=Saccharothrix sp. NRRL B-16314 TaxID=1463825 RepID=UPI001E45AF31|nr:AAA family ATPase [Saccharothrix sp. NRRL B-16314]
MLRENSASNSMVIANIYVTRGLETGWRIRVVSDSLAGLSDAERRSLLLSGLEEWIEAAELLTSAEEGWYGPPPLEIDGPLPIWSEALKQSSSQPLLFASDLDEDIKSPAIVTFYSLRGGVGRTTALAAAAKLLAARGRRVLCVDMDFEAPGLHYMFHLDEPRTEQGVIPLLLALERGESVDIRDHVQRVSEADELYCLPSGRLGVDYAQRLRLIEPENWYREERNPLHALLELASESSIQPEIILLDSRTGISPISAPLLFDISDLAVVCFFPHPQAHLGTELLVQSLLAAKTRRSDAGHAISPEPRFLVSPIPPGPSAARFRERAVSWIDTWLARVGDRRSSDTGPLQADELTHVIGYSPETAFKDFMDTSVIVNETYGPVADWLEQLLPRPVAPSTVRSVDKREALVELNFSRGQAEEQENLLDDFVKTRVAVQASDPQYPLVIGRKGTGKTAVFRWLLDRPGGDAPVVVMCPHTFRKRFPWVLGAEGFAAIDNALTENQAGWSRFWACYTALATFLSLPRQPGTLPPERFGLDLENLETSDRADELFVVETVTKMISDAQAGLLAGRWLRELDASLSSSRFLLFDGLDTGFGNDVTSRNRRTDAVAGLFTFLTESETRLDHLSFKVLLRFDIWQQLRFENKSHLFGRYVQLLWKDQADYFKTVLKQAVRSSAFQNLLSQVGVGPNVDSWRSEEVYQAWNVLVGERMKGAKTTFTRNWVWNRLADGQGDHSPRTLSQLFAAAVEWESRERTSYDQSVVRPRALVPSLERVSDEAVGALHEEFPELKSIVDALETIGRTPLVPGDIESVKPGALEHLELALEVGLIAVHEGTQEEVRRYRVPDLYRHALGMTRRGQA